MINNYKVKVNGSSEIDITNEDASKIDAIKSGDSKYHILNGNKPYEAEIVEANFNKKNYKVKVNNNIYDIDISNPLDLLIKEMGFSLGSTKAVNSIKAPMPGLILDISVEVGQEVKEDDNLLILEAMKMENIITSPRDGVIKSVSIGKSDAVEKGQLLIEFE